MSPPSHIALMLTPQQVVDLKMFMGYNGADRIKRFCDDSDFKLGIKLIFEGLNPATVSEFMEDIFRSIDTGHMDFIMCDPKRLNKP